MTNYDVDYLRTDLVEETFNAENWYSARLTNGSIQKGNIWIRYCNIGTYNGQIIDLKVTLSSWNYRQPANTSAISQIGGVNYPCVMFSKSSIDIVTSVYPAIDSPEWKFTYYINGTEEPISIKSHLTFKDIDGSIYGGNEKIIFKTGFDKVYKSTNSYLTLSNTYCVNEDKYATSNDDQNAWITCLCSGSEIKFIYTRYADIYGNQYNDISEKAPNDNRGFYHFIVSSDAIAPFDFVNPKKQVNIEMVTDTESFKYTISHFIPGESKEYYYTSYEINDTIENCLEIENIKIVDDTGTDISNWFDGISDYEEQDIKLIAKDSTLENANFYNNNIYIEITVKKKENYNMLEWFNEEKDAWTISNTASISIATSTNASSRTETLYTNTVNVDIYPKKPDNIIDKLPKAGGTGQISNIIIGGMLITISYILKSKIKK